MVTTKYMVTTKQQYTFMKMTCFMREPNALMLIAIKFVKSLRIRSLCGEAYIIRTPVR